MSNDKNNLPLQLDFHQWKLERTLGLWVMTEAAMEERASLLQDTTRSHRPRTRAPEVQRKILGTLATAGQESSVIGAVTSLTEGMDKGFT